MDILDYAVLMVSCVVEIYMCKEFVVSFYEKRYCKWYQSSIIDLIMIVILYTVNLNGNTNLNLAAVSVVLLIYIRIICKINTTHAIMCFLIVFSVLMGGEVISVAIANVTNFDSESNLSEMPWMTFASKLLSYIILISIIQLFGRNINKVNKNTFGMYLVISTASVAWMLMNCFIAKSTVLDTSVKIELSSSFLLVLLANIAIFKALCKYDEQLQKNMEQSWIISRETMNKEYCIKAKRLNEERQTLMHDLKQYVHTANLLLQQKEYSAAKEILEALGEKISSSETQIYVNNPQIDAVLSERANYIKNKEICFRVNIEPAIQFTTINMPDYIVMLGNLLDNAVQAAEKCTDKREITVNFFLSENGSFIVCKITNTFNPECLKEKAGELISTKKEPGVHGLGIKSVMKTASLNGGYFMSKVEADCFVSILAVPF